MTDTLRERLRTLADEIPPQLTMPPRLHQRAGRRSAITIVGGVVILLVLIVVSIAAMQGFLRSGRRLPLDAPPRPPADLSGYLVLVDMFGGQEIDLDSGLVRSTHLAGDASPGAWSPDGSRLLVWKRHGVLAMIGPDGTTTDISSDSYVFPGSWSPDGTRIVVGVAKRDAARIVVIDVETGAVTRIASGLGEPASPSWSPDGSTIAFRRWNSETERGELWLMDPDGPDVRALVADPTIDVGWEQPSWSPDGSRLAFAAELDLAPGELASGDSDILVVSVDGSTLARLTMSERFAHAASWSPDGSRIAFISSARQEISLMDPNGTNVRRLGVVAVKDAALIWPPLSAHPWRLR